MCKNNFFNENTELTGCNACLSIAYYVCVIETGPLFDNLIVGMIQAAQLDLLDCKLLEVFDVEQQDSVIICIVDELDEDWSVLDIHEKSSHFD